MMHCWPNRALLALALSMTICGTGCVNDPPLDPATPKETRVVLPQPPADFGKPVPIPARTANVKIWAMRASEALKTANRRLTDDAAFYGDVEQQFGK